MTPRTALVTGGTRGIGLGIARALAREGWNLVLCGTRPEADVAATLDELRQSGGAVGYEAADLSQRGRSACGWSRRCGAKYGALQRAGQQRRARAAAARRSPRRRRGQLRRADPHEPAGPVLPHAGRSRASRSRAARRIPSFTAAIVFITSVSAEMASVNRGEYCVSKAGLSMAARLFAVRLAGHGIPVYEVRPGIIATDMTAGVKEVYDTRIADGLVPERRWGTPDDVGRIVAALLRGDAPYATGSVIDVDGGLSLPRLIGRGSAERRMWNTAGKRDLYWLRLRSCEVPHGRSDTSRHVAAAALQGPDKTTTVRAFVFTATGASGQHTPEEQGRLDAVRDMREALEKKKGITARRHPAAANLLMEVMGREQREEPSGGRSAASRSRGWATRSSACA